MSGDVTDADRETARAFVVDLIYAPTPEYRDEVERDLAAALAAEREKARAPFLALADDLAGWQDNAVRYASHSADYSTTAAMARARAMAYGRAIDAIHRATQDPQ